MVVQITDPQTIRVIEGLSRRTGRTLEQEVDIAVHERLARLRTSEEEAERRAKVYETVKQLQAAFKASGLPLIDHGELLYDENGLPREGELTEIGLRYSFPSGTLLPKTKTEAKHGDPDRSTGNHPTHRGSFAADW
jgi:antitoxin VapB